MDPSGWGSGISMRMRASRVLPDHVVCTLKLWDIKTYGTVTRASMGPAPDAGEWWGIDTGLLRSTPGLGNWFGFYLMTTD